MPISVAKGGRFTFTFLSLRQLVDEMQVYATDQRTLLLKFRVTVFPRSEQKWPFTLSAAGNHRTQCVLLDQKRMTGAPFTEPSLGLQSGKLRR
jgi:hypothetical protein